MKKRKLFLINLSGLVLLGAGFLVAIIIPKLSIMTMGLDRYGSFAVLLAVSMIVSFADLGLTPGMTRELSVMYAKDEKREIRALTKKIIGYLLSIGIFLTLLSVTVGLNQTSKVISNSEATISIILGSLAVLIVILSDINTISVKVADGIIAANIAKSSYYVSYLAIFLIFFYFDKINVSSLFASQLGGAIIYAILGSFLVKTHYLTVTNISHSALTIPWRRLYILGVPDQLGKVSSAFIPGIERNLMLSVGGGGAVSAYDISQRLSAMVTAIPSSMAAPLIALLPPNISTNNQATIKIIVKHTNTLIFFIVSITTLVTLIFINRYAESYFHLEGTEFITYVNLIIISNAINILTATPVAILQSHNQTAPIVMKAVFDLLTTLASIFVLWYFNSVLGCIATRSIGLVVSSISFLIFFLSKKT